MRLIDTCRVLLPSFALLLQGCFGGDDPSDPPPAEGPAGPGDYSLCSYTENLGNDGYASARLSHPCELEDGPFPATTLTGGFTNTKESMYWLADHLTSHGYVVLTMTPTNILGSPPVWEEAHKAGIEELRDEASRADSPVYQRIREDRLGITGFSMGGGGTLLAAADLGNDHDVVTALPLAPWLGSHTPNYMNITASTLVLGGSADTLSPASTVGSYYESLPTDITRGIAIYNGANHGDWYGSSGDAENRNRFKTLTTAWLKRYLDDDASYQGYFDGEEHDQHLAADWFTRYDYRP